MKKLINNKMTAIVTIAFSILTVIEGSQVLLGVTQPDYIVFMPLLVYNITMGGVGILVGVMIWINHSNAFRYTAIITTTHLTVLLIVGSVFITGGDISTHSVQAMTIRLLIWLVITGTAWGTSKSEMVKSKIY